MSYVTKQNAVNAEICSYCERVVSNSAKVSYFGAIRFDFGAFRINFGAIRFFFLGIRSGNDNGTAFFAEKRITDFVR